MGTVEPIQTEFMRRKVQAEGWDTELGVWGRGVDPDLFSPARRCQDLRWQLGLGPDDVAALWLGRVVQEKKPGVWLRVRRECCHSCRLRPHMEYYFLLYKWG